MKTGLFSFVFILLCLHAEAQQSNMLQQLYYHNPGGLGFIPTMNKPGLVYDGKLYTGKQLDVLFAGFKDEQMQLLYKKYKNGKTWGNILVYSGTALSLANIFISANRGSINWWIVGANVLLNASGGAIKNMAQLQLLQAAMYQNATQIKSSVSMALPPTPYQFSIAIPLTK